jgi:Lrp/AsnC family transcriptional regulator for asnA, asnC and gidA
MNETIDRIDTEIIRLLKKDGRMPNTEIARRLPISETTVRKRLKRLIEEEYIQIIAVGNLPKLINKLRREIVGNMKVKIDIKKTDYVIRELKDISELWYIAHITGAADFDLEFSVQSQDDLRLLLERINNIEGITHTETSIRLQIIRNRYDWEYPNFDEDLKAPMPNWDNPIISRQDEK